VVCLRQGLHVAALLATCQQVQLPGSEQAGNKLSVRITYRNEKAMQSASSTLVHNLVSEG
jgi:hypothetical protein